MFTVGPQDIPLCLNCNALFQQTISRQNEDLKEQINFWKDNADSMFGIHTGARYPTKRPVIVSGGTVNHNHISVTDSQIGILNTGNIANLNQTIDSLYSASQKDLGDNLKKFSETLLKEKDLTDDQKTQVLESLDFITKELFQKPENKKKSLVKILFGQISSTVGVAANSLTIWQILHPLLQVYFK